MRRGRGRGGELREAVEKAWMGEGGVKEGGG